MGLMYGHSSAHRLTQARSAKEQQTGSKGNYLPSRVTASCLAKVDKYVLHYAPTSFTPDALTVFGAQQLPSHRVGPPHRLRISDLSGRNYSLNQIKRTRVSAAVVISPARYAFEFRVRSKMLCVFQTRRSLMKLL
jgi:hypothetical protein